MIYKLLSYLILFDSHCSNVRIEIGKERTRTDLQLCVVATIFTKCIIASSTAGHEILVLELHRDIRMFDYH